MALLPSMGNIINNKNYALFGMPDIPVKERILKALIESAKHTESVAGPYVLIDTKNLEYEVVDKGGENH